MKPTQERRRDPRTRQENKVVLTPIGAAGEAPPVTYYSLTRDISVGGIRILTDAPLAVDSRVRVEVALTRSRSRIEAEARVRWVKELFGKDVYETGLEFVGMDPEVRLTLMEHLYGRAKRRE